MIVKGRSVRTFKECEGKPLWLKRDGAFRRVYTKELRKLAYDEALECIEEWY